MRDELDVFLDGLKNIRLSAAEKSSIQAGVRNHVRNGAHARLTGDMDEKGFLQTAQNVRLSPAERVLIRESLIEHMSKQKGISLSGLLRRMVSVTAAFVIIAGSGAGLSYAAESSLPGDLLYPVKVQVNEPLLTSLNRTPEARARFEARKAQRRLEEAQALAQRASLKADVAEKIMTRFQEHTAQIQTEMQMLIDAEKNSEASDIGIDFDATLVAYGNVLNALNADAQTTEIATLVDAVHEARLQTEEATLSAARKNRNMAKENIEKAWSEAKNEIDAVQKILSNPGRPLAPEVQKRLRSAQEVLEISGSASSATDDEQLRWSRSALRNAREAKAFINLSGRTSSAGSENNDDSDLHIRQKQDAEFSTSVRLRMTKKRVQQAEKRIRETLKDLDENTSVNIETRVEGTRQLLDIANTQLENGNLDEALETSDSALDHADSVTEDIEKLVPGL